MEITNIGLKFGIVDRDVSSLAELSAKGGSTLYAILLLTTFITQIKRVFLCSVCRLVDSLKTQLI
jgi:hypothetical protein